MLVISIFYMFSVKIQKLGCSASLNSLVCVCFFLTNFVKEGKIFNHQTSKRIENIVAAA